MTGVEGFHAHLLSAPSGFIRSLTAIEKVCAAPKPTLALIRQIVRFERDNTGDVAALHHVRSFHLAGVDVSEVEMRNAISGLTFIHQGASRAGAEASRLQEVLLISTCLSEHACEVVTAAMERAMAQAGSADADGDGDGGSGGGGGGDLLKVGQLTGVTWKVGVALQSSSCDSLRSPYVGLNLDVSDSSGNAKTVALELSYAEFQDLKRELTRAAAAMEG